MGFLFRSLSTVLVLLIMALFSFIETSAGLPNNCSQCAQPIIGDHWHAEHEDAARSGRGLCITCKRKQEPGAEEVPVDTQTAPAKASAKK